MNTSIGEADDGRNALVEAQLAPTQAIALSRQQGGRLNQGAVRGMRRTVIVGDGRSGGICRHRDAAISKSASVGYRQ